MGKLIAHMRHDTRIFWANWWAQFRAAAVLRGAFALQILGMVVNNMGLLLAWLFLFERFGTINGWSGAEFIAMSGTNMFIFGLVILFSSGLPHLPRYVDTGSFDTYLTKPVSVLAQVASSSIEIATIGDILLGAVLIVGYIVYAHITLALLGAFLLALVVGCIIMWCFTLLPFILAFYVFDSDKVARAAAFFFLDSGIYPTGVITGKLRIILLTVWPGFFIGAVPVEVIRGFHWEYLLLGFAVAAFWLAASLWLFKKSLRKYESANLVGAR